MDTQMQDHQTRVVTERFDLNVKIESLAKFLDTEIYYSLALSEQGRLLEQLGIMNQYRDVLDRRIAAF